MGGRVGKSVTNPSRTGDSGGGKKSAPNNSSPQHLAELRKLFSEEGQLMNRRIKELFEIVFEGSAPQTLDINMKFINIEESGARYLSKVLPAFTSLKSLRLWKTHLGVEGAKLLASALPKLPQLEVLSLEDNEIMAEGIGSIASNLPSLPELSELYLHINRLGQEGVVALSPALALKTNLRILAIDENQIRKPGLLVLLTSLSRTLHCITLLGLSYNELGDDGARELIATLKKMPELRRMTLSGNNISSAVEAEIIASAPGANFLF